MSDNRSGADRRESTERRLGERRVHRALRTGAAANSANRRNRLHFVANACDMKKPPEGGYHIEKAGWGGRIRTSVWRNQNPLPYHLATPHHGTWRT
jgi:hypothetical protein